LCIRIFQLHITKKKANEKQIGLVFRYNLNNSIKLKRLIYFFVLVFFFLNVKAQHFVAIQVAPLSFENAPDSLSGIENYVLLNPSLRFHYQLIDKTSGFGIQTAFMGTYHNQNLVLGTQLSIQKQIFEYFNHHVAIGLGPSFYFTNPLTQASDSPKYSISWICPNISYFYDIKKKRKKYNWSVSVSLSQDYKSAYALYFSVNRKLADWNRKTKCDCPQFH
jgi:hypothetical protein